MRWNVICLISHRKLHFKVTMSTGNIFQNYPFWPILRGIGQFSLLIFLSARLFVFLPIFKIDYCELIFFCLFNYFQDWSLSANLFLSFYQCVTVPKMLNDTDTFFPVPNIFDTGSETFSGTKFFRYLYAVKV